MKQLVSEKIVNIAALKIALGEYFECPHAAKDENFKDKVDEFVQANIEMPAAEAAGLNHHEANIYEIIDNVDEFRDCVNEFIDSKKGI